MSNKNTLPILDSQGNFERYPQFIMAGAMNFPECYRSIAHYRQIVGGEEVSTPGNRSTIGEMISTATNSRMGQGMIAGEVAVALIWLSNHSPPPSVGKATRIGVEIAKASSRGHKQFRPQTINSVDRAFKDFRSCCHLWAANTLFRELFLEAATCTERLSEFLEKAAAVEERLDAMGILENWKPWRIPSKFRGRVTLDIHDLNGLADEALKDYQPRRRS